MNTRDTNDPFQEVLPSVHEAVRKSALLIALHNKLESLPPGSFPFAAELGRLRDKIAPQIGDTRILFPEFTPHDEALHVAKLFQLADKLFGPAYEQLKAAELFLLARALYAHDWGMAVGQHEKGYLRHGASADYFRDTFSPLPDESERLEAFVRAEGLERGPDRKFSPLSDDHLRLYVRLTHARRSGVRVRAHFHEHPAVGQALAHLCEGHWHDFGTLDDPYRFPRDYEVAGQTTHLLALALQVRLIDLFHITDDRTPYALWRFVSPTDRRSDEEWRKHRALHGVAVIDFPPGRAIKIQGFTEDEEVWAGLQDLRRYCEDQINRTLDLCARHVPQRYMLDFLKLEWAVTTGTLRPVELSFGFDSGAMFRILSDDIYDGDRYVFLRELLQNSIDAIRTRRTRHEQRARGPSSRKRSGLSFDTTIYFTAEHQSNGDVFVSCRDYGVGMDEYVIRNYFTVAGVSYYRSEEFQRQHLGFEPISRFGIGILSCFMVADALDVTTYRDPECGPAMTYSDAELPGAEEHRARRLHLRIPGVERQFIVKDVLDVFEVGTEVSLRVLRKKAQVADAKPTTSGGADKATDDTNPDFKRTLEITEYLCQVAGFVEMPILVVENWPGRDSAKSTLILHPDQDAEKERKQFGEDVVVHQLSRAYPWDKVTAPESIDMVHELMTERRFELRELLGAEGYEGWIVFPTPRSEEWDFGPMTRGLPESGTMELRKRDNDESEQGPIYWDEEQWPQIRKYGVYRDGILLRNMEAPRRIRESHESHSQALPPVLMHVNLLSSESPRPNVSRTALKPALQAWDTSIWSAIDNRIRETSVAAALAKPPEERLYDLGWLCSVFYIPVDVMLHAVPNAQMSTLWLTSTGKLQIREGAFSNGEEVPGLPAEAESHFFRQVTHLWHLPCDSKVRYEWRGPVSLGPPTGGITINRWGRSVPLAAIMRLLEGWRMKSLVKARVQFLEPPEGHPDVIVQFVYIVDLGDRSDAEASGSVDHRAYLKQPEVTQALQVALESPQDLQPHQRERVSRAIRCPIPVPFSDPFSRHFACSSVLNSLHTAGNAVLRCLAACSLAERDNRIPKVTLKDFESCTFSFKNANWPRETMLLLKLEAISAIGIQDVVARLFTIIADHKIIDGFVAPPIPDASEFVPNIRDTNTSRADSTAGNESEHPSVFGRVITEWPLPQGKGG